MSIQRLTQPMSVKQLTLKIKQMLESESGLQRIYVRGELSNFKRHSSGHLYFTLKDDSAQIRCVMFRSRSSGLRFAPENGMAVVVLGSVSVYERDGQYQLYVDDIQPDGVGALYQAFIQLKQRLEAEGLFREEIKRPLPLLPRKVGVVTSLGGAAVRDIINVARRRWPRVSLVLANVLVQGEDAPEDIARGISLVSRVPEVDVLIVGRGGGSIEELFCFNSEIVARAIRASEVPVVSAVGHETDFTIADFAADLRAPTPSAAAELSVPDVRQLLERLSVLDARMLAALRRRISEKRYALGILASGYEPRRARDRLRQRRQTVDGFSRDLDMLVTQRFRDSRLKIAALAGTLEALSPMHILARGYAICMTKQGMLVKQTAQVKKGDLLDVRLARGKLECVVREKT